MPISLVLFFAKNKVSNSSNTAPILLPVARTNQVSFANLRNYSPNIVFDKLAQSATKYRLELSCGTPKNLNKFFRNVRKI